jgi:hypothetical protein
VSVIRAGLCDVVEASATKVGSRQAAVDDLAAFRTEAYSPPMTTGYPCSSPGCKDPAAWASLSETECGARTCGCVPGRAALTCPV